MANIISTSSSPASSSSSTNVVSATTAAAATPKISAKDRALAAVAAVAARKAAEKTVSANAGQKGPKGPRVPKQAKAPKAAKQSQDLATVAQASDGSISVEVSVPKGTPLGEGAALQQAPAAAPKRRNAGAAKEYTYRGYTMVKAIGTGPRGEDQWHSTGMVNNGVGRYRNVGRGIDTTEMFASIYKLRGEIDRLCAPLTAAELELMSQNAEKAAVEAAAPKPLQVTIMAVLHRQKRAAAPATP